MEYSLVICLIVFRRNVTTGRALYHSRTGVLFTIPNTGFPYGSRRGGKRSSSTKHSKCISLNDKMISSRNKESVVFKRFRTMCGKEQWLRGGPEKQCLCQIMKSNKAIYYWWCQSIYFLVSFSHMILSGSIRQGWDQTRPDEACSPPWWTLITCY